MERHKLASARGGSSAASAPASAALSSGAGAGAGEREPAVPLRLAVRYRPPALLLEYRAGRAGDLRRRLMPLRGLDGTSSARAYARALVKRNRAFIGPDLVAHEQLLELVQEIIDHQGQAEEAEKPRPSRTLPLAPLRRPDAADVAAVGDLNKVSVEELKAAKVAMDVDFERNRIRPDDPRYVHDKRADFTPSSEPNEWDEDMDDEALSESFSDGSFDGE